MASGRDGGAPRPVDTIDKGTAGQAGLEGGKTLLDHSESEFRHISGETWWTEGGRYPGAQASDKQVGEILKHVLPVRPGTVWTNPIGPDCRSESGVFSPGKDENFPLPSREDGNA